MEKKNLSDFRKAFSLNDRFRFRRELFGGNEEKMNKAISDLNDLSSYEESVTYLNKVLNPEYRRRFRSRFHQAIGKTLLINIRYGKIDCSPNPCW
ncbi:hypothetical protein NXX40_20010 [Parabacteroides distasonis]|nr:hypothetical protein [Parabacteroides distasonis]